MLPGIKLGLTPMQGKCPRSRLSSSRVVVFLCSCILFVSRLVVLRDSSQFLALESLLAGWGGKGRGELWPEMGFLGYNQVSLE